MLLLLLLLLLMMMTVLAELLHLITDALMLRPPSEPTQHRLPSRCQF
jgi:hypothetical protein